MLAQSEKSLICTEERDESIIDEEEEHNQNSKPPWLSHFSSAFDI